MPTDRNCIYDPSHNPLHNCHAHYRFEVIRFSWKLEISEIELTKYDTQNVMNIDGHILPCYFLDAFCNPTTKTPYTFVWFSDDYCLFLHYKIFQDE